MLTKRTNILFDEDLFQYLVFFAQKNKTSVGDLVRKAVVKVYVNNTNENLKLKALRLRAYNNILKLRKKIKPIADHEIKEFINYGRKY